MEKHPKKKLLEEDFHNGDFRYNLDTELEQQLRTMIQQQLWSLQHDRRCTMVEWSLVRPAIEQHLICPVVSLMTQLIECRERVIRKLQAKLNQSSFHRDPERDTQIAVLSRQGLSNSQIGRVVGMSKEGIRQALLRLGGKAFAVSEELERKEVSRCSLASLRSRSFKNKS